MGRTDFEDYISLGYDINELFVEKSAMVIDGVRYDTAEQLKMVLHQLSIAGFHYKSI